MQLYPSGFLKLLVFLHMPQIRNLGSTIQQMLHDVPGLSYQDKLNHLSNCNCCLRHQVNKPTVFVPWHETPFHNNQITHLCTCNCRHVARFICRQAPGYTTRFITRKNTPVSIIDF